MELKKIVPTVSPSANRQQNQAQQRAEQTRDPVQVEEFEKFLDKIIDQQHGEQNGRRFRRFEQIFPIVHFDEILVRFLQKKSLKHFAKNFGPRTKTGPWAMGQIGIKDHGQRAKSILCLKIKRNRRRNLIIMRPAKRGAQNRSFLSFEPYASAPASP